MRSQSESNSVHKRYQSPTISSRSKMTFPATVNQRLMSLSSAMNDIKRDIITQSGQMMSLQKQNHKLSQIFSGQVKALRNAFNTLGDVVVQSQIRQEYQGRINTLSTKVDILDAGMSKLESQNYSLKNQLINLQERNFVGSRSKEYQEFQIRQQFKEEINQQKKQNAVLFDSIRNIVRKNTKLLDSLSGDLKRAMSQVQSIKYSTSASEDISREHSDLSKRLIQFQRLQAIRQKDIETFQFQARNSSDVIKGQLQYLKDFVSNIQGNFKNQLKITLDNAQQKCDIVNDSSQQKWSKMQRILTQYDTKLTTSLLSMQQSIDEARTSMLKSVDSSISTSAVSLEALKQKVSCLNYKSVSQVKSIQVLGIQQILSTQRKQLFSNITQVQQYLGKKADKLTQAIYIISRQLKISNPLIDQK